MPSESFRFIHASDFHLEVPLADLDALPPHLKEPLASAPRKAAEAVFEAALADSIDFVVLSGDLLNPLAAGPHGMSLLLEQFDRLHAKGKLVFWVAGSVDDPQRWPDAVPLPANVTLFPKNRSVSVPVQRGGRTICRVVGRSSEGRGTLHVPSYRTDPTDEFTVGVGYGTTTAEALAEARFDYWALGGEHNRQELECDDTVAVYAGSPQGRSLNEPGPHGYTIVDVDADHQIRLHAVEADSFRYQRVDVAAAEITQVGNLRSLLGERIGRLQHDNGGRQLLIGWDIAVANGDNLHHIGDADELLRWLRREYGHGMPAAWTAQLIVRPPSQFPKSWHDEDTILGDFLRAAGKQRKQDGRDIELMPFTEEQTELSAEGLGAAHATLLGEMPASVRATILDQATLLGVEMLRGGKPKRVQSS